MENTESLGKGAKGPSELVDLLIDSKTLLLSILADDEEGLSAGEVFTSPSVRGDAGVTIAYKEGEEAEEGGGFEACLAC